jgi:hypothetical protein
MSEVMDFSSLAPIEIPVKLPNGKDYILREASEADSIVWRDAVLDALKFVDGKMTGARRLTDTEVMLVASCLCETGSDGSLKVTQDGHPVKVPSILVRSLPARIVKALFERAKEISDLNEKPVPETIRKSLACLPQQVTAFSADERAGIRSALEDALRQVSELAPESQGTPEKN